MLAGPMPRKINRFNIGSFDKLMGVGVGLGVAVAVRVGLGLGDDAGVRGAVGSCPETVFSA